MLFRWAIASGFFNCECLAWTGRNDFAHALLRCFIGPGDEPAIFDGEHLGQRPDTVAAVAAGVFVPIDFIGLFSFADVFEIQSRRAGVHSGSTASSRIRHAPAGHMGGVQELVIEDMSVGDAIGPRYVDPGVDHPPWSAQVGIARLDVLD